MGKTKTAFVAEAQESNKTSEQKYKEKREKQKKEEEAKVHISGLKGGQRVKIISAEEPVAGKEIEAKEKTNGVFVKTRSKNYLGAKAKIKSGEKYKVLDAIKLVKETSYSKFDGTMELHLVVKKAGISAQVTLPHSAGKAKKVEVANEETVKKLQNGKIDFDILLATPDMMPELVPFAKILGPRGLMPNPKTSTIIKSIKEAEKFKGNSISLRTEKEAPLIHTVIGKVSQTDKELIENIEAVLSALGGEKQIVRAFLKSTMSPSVKLSV